MPLVRIDLLEGRPETARQQIADAIHLALVDTMGVTDDDRFQIVTEHPPGGMRYAPQYGATSRTDALVVISITLNAGRTAVMKQAFYRRAVQLLQERAGLRPEDVFIGLVEVDPDNWYVP
jgi:phenylpyruvate tautomerase PptA (4-oxalocrotonate tautomerase family)